MTLSQAILAAMLATLPKANPADLESISVAIEAAHGEFDPWMLAALVVRESGGNLDALGDLGECGPTQVMGWYLTPSKSCAELRDPLTAIQSSVQMLRFWADKRPDRDPWQCYASGNRCRAERSKRKLVRIRAELMAIGVDSYVHDVYIDLVRGP